MCVGVVMMMAVGFGLSSDGSGDTVEMRHFGIGIMVMKDWVRGHRSRFPFVLIARA